MRLESWAASKGSYSELKAHNLKTALMMKRGGLCNAKIIGGHYRPSI